MNVTKDAKHLISPAITLAVMLSVLVPFVHGAPKDSTNTLEFNAQGGRVRVFLPDDLSAGDRISSSFRIYPDGTTAEARDKNSALLSALIIETSYFSAPVSEGSITFEVPKNAGGSTLVFTLVGKDGKRLGSSRVPVKFPEQGTRRPEKPTPFDYQCPVVGQAGRLIEIKGPFDGDFGTTDFKVGGVKPFVLSESPRKLVFESPAEVSGTVDLILNEQEVVVNRPYTCLQVVKIDEKGVTPVSSSHSDSTFITETAVREEALPPVKQSLSFDSIKTEETLSGPPPDSAPEFAVTEDARSGSVNDLPPARADTPDGQKAVIIARQMDARMHARSGSPNRSSGKPVTRPAASTPLKAEAAEVAAAAEPDGDLVEKPLEEIKPDMSPAKPEPDADPRKASSDAPGSSLTGEIALKAGIVEGQMLALYKPSAGLPAVNPGRTSPGNAAPPKASAKKGFSVQVASLRFPDDADLLAAELRKKGYGAYVVPVEIPGKGKLYRVRIGAFKVRKEASSYAAGLKKKDPVFKSVFVAEND